MRTWFIILSICIALATLCVTEVYVVGNFCKDMEASVSKVCESIITGKIKVQQLDDLSFIWEKNKNYVFAFSNHNAFSDYEKLIADMYYYYNKGDRERLYYCAVTLENTNEHLKFATEYSFGNIF